MAAVMVTAELVFYLHQPRGWSRVPVGLCYDPADPYAVRAEFRDHNGGELAVWLLDRDLLAEGLIAPTGAGDVRVGPAPGDPTWTQITLSSPHGRVVFSADAAQIVDFLAATVRVVPPGGEYAGLDVDAELRGLIERGWVA